MSITKLSMQETEMAGLCGWKRKVSSLYSNHNKNKGRGYGENVTKEIGADIVGALCEAAVAKILGIWFPYSVNTFKNESDLPHGIEVRGTDLARGSLIVRSNDKDDAIFVLCILVKSNDDIRGWHYNVKGWMYGHDAKKIEWSRSPNGGKPAYFVPQQALRSIEELRNVIREKKTLHTQTLVSCTKGPV